MADANIAPRDTQGEWQPEKLPVPGPLFRWPPQPLATLRYLFGTYSLLWPFNAVYFALAVVSWYFLLPGMEKMASLSLDWIALVYLRNAGLLTVVAGGLHLRLYIKRAQGTKYKYSDKWLSKRDKRFLFRNQTLDNMFWSLVSGCGIWSIFESIVLWAYANNWLPYVNWSTNPVYSTLLIIGILLFRQIHFYWIHRFTHWRPLYKAAHYLHHKNINVGPWTGMSMHPIEHLFYLSGVFLHFILPSHPIHMIFHGMHTGLSPAKGHSGFNKYVLSSDHDSEKERIIKAGGYFHYLHHRYFTVNFGVEGVPLDKWFGSFHDGSPGAQAAMITRRKRRAGKQNRSPGDVTKDPQG